LILHDWQHPLALYPPSGEKTLVEYCIKDTNSNQCGRRVDKSDQSSSRQQHEGSGEIKKINEKCQRLLEVTKKRLCGKHEL
jgi:hypothetical protein